MKTAIAILVLAGGLMAADDAQTCYSQSAKWGHKHRAHQVETYYTPGHCYQEELYLNRLGSLATFIVRDIFDLSDAKDGKTLAWRINAIVQPEAGKLVFKGKVDTNGEVAGEVSKPDSTHTMTCGVEDKIVPCDVWYRYVTDHTGGDLFRHRFERLKGKNK
jgi:hypothetical protein